MKYLFYLYMAFFGVLSGQLYAQKDTTKTKIKPKPEIIEAETDTLGETIKEQNLTIDKLEQQILQQKAQQNKANQQLDKAFQLIEESQLRRDSLQKIESKRLSLLEDHLFKLDTLYKNQEKREASQNFKKYFSGNKIFWTFFFFILAYVGVRVVSSILKILAEKSPKNRITFMGLIPIFKILIWVITLSIIILGIFHPPLETIIAVSASVAIAVGFAAQDILKNMFGGISILIDSPFKVGDKISVGEHYGEVVEIGLVSTRMITPNNSIINIPNGQVVSAILANANSGEPYCEVVASIYLSPTIDIHRAKQIAIEAAKTSQYVYLNKPIVVWFDNELKMDNAYLKMSLKAFVLDIRYEFDFKSDMTEIVLTEIHKQQLV